MIIGSFKSAVAKLIRRAGRKDFQWHKSYYDRIIRSDEELERIREYIRNNPARTLTEQAMDFMGLEMDGME